MAKLYFRYSSMGAGKSIDLLKVAYNYEERNLKVMLFIPEIDNRHGVGKITTRIGLQRDAKAVSKEFNFYEYVLQEGSFPSCILIDEAQFLTKKQVVELSDIVDYLNIPVMCYGLRTDFKLEFFEGSSALMEYADKIEELITICDCGKKATINMRIVDGKPTNKGEQVLIGGNESYISVCRACYKKRLGLNKKEIN